MDLHNLNFAGRLPPLSINGILSDGCYHYEIKTVLDTPHVSCSILVGLKTCKYNAIVMYSLTLYHTRCRPLTHYQTTNF